MNSSYKHTLALAEVGSVKKLELYCGRLDAVNVNIGRTIMELGRTGNSIIVVNAMLFTIGRQELTGLDAVCVTGGSM
jgi:hypothetical protein